jgi:hypothetical protein
MMGRSQFSPLPFSVSLSKMQPGAAKVCHPTKPERRQAGVPGARSSCALGRKAERHKDFRELLECE